VDTLACCLHLVPCVVLLDAINDIKYGIGEDIGSIKGDCCETMLFPLRAARIGREGETDLGDIKGNKLSVSE